ncbi:MAG: alpha/beta fold hydrolase [Streptosporangiales bacterium]|nr:alpha/beta fold hydrolase [Streptosporangiales bacterium]
MRSTVERHELTSAGLRISYLEEGHGGSEVVLLLHDGGFGGSADTSFRGLIPLLVEQGYRVLAPDLVGFGSSQKAVFLDEAPFAVQIRTLSDFVSQLDAEQAHVVGNSFGGTVALRNLCAGNPLHANTVTSIGGTGGPWRVPEGMRPLLEYDGSEAAMAALVDVLAVEPPDPEYVVRRNEVARQPGHYQALVAPRANAPRAPEGPPRVDSFLEDLAGSTVPILLIAGKNDPTNEPEWWTHIEAVTSDVRTVVLDSRHSPNIDTPATVAAAFVEWQRSLAARNS